MRTHEFQPGRLVAGLALLVAGVLYVLDGTGRIDVAWFLVIPLALGGLALAALTGLVGYAIRRDRRARREESADH
ncbi:hypothetical protein ACN20G_08970 [Streptomyces sp. BI20]|uniref:hypothetical protein n=1 Tax=Streptomyces sp. BI20 TaxID=3403460 RepID=UPI003C74B2C1